MQPMQAREVQIAAIHDVERTGFPGELIEDVHIVDAARRHNDDGGKVALEREQRVEFDSRFAAAERGPGKQREAQINGGGVQRIGRRLEFDAEGIVGVKRGGLLDEDVREVGEEAPVAFFVGVGQRAARGGLADAGVIKFRAEGSQTGFDVAETFAPGQLSESQHEELFVSGEFSDAEVAAVTGDTLVEIVFGQEVQELGEDGATFVHKIENRQTAVINPQRAVAKLKSKKAVTAKESRF